MGYLDTYRQRKEFEEIFIKSPELQKLRWYVNTFPHIKKQSGEQRYGFTTLLSAYCLCVIHRTTSATPTHHAYITKISTMIKMTKNTITYAIHGCGCWPLSLCKYTALF